MNSFFSWLKSLFTPAPIVYEFPTPPAPVVGVRPPVVTPAPIVPVLVVPQPVIGNPTLKGGDFSHYEPTVAWKEYAEAKYAFAFTKCADGLGSKDSAFDHIREGAHNAGVPFAGYFFFRFGGHSPQEQARLFYKSWTGGIQKGEMMPIVDFEWDNQTAGGRYANGKETDMPGNNLFMAFLLEVEQLFGATPMIYTGRSFMPMKDPRFSRFPLWVFDYHNNPPRLPPSWSTHLFHQFTDKNKFPGATGNADCSYFNGSREDLALLVKK